MLGLSRGAICITNIIYGLHEVANNTTKTLQFTHSTVRYNKKPRAGCIFLVGSGLLTSYNNT